MTNEVWKAVTLNGEIFDRYQVSNLGRIRSLQPGNRIKSSSDILSPSLRGGYQQARITKSIGMSITTRVHTLVAEAFLGRRPVGMTVNHRDGIKTNNEVANLEYVTPLGNIQHAKNTGLRAKVSTRSAMTRDRNGTRGNKITFEQAQAVRNAVQQGNSMRSVGKSFGISHQTVSDIVAGKYWNPAPATDE
jgi:hypothetical protein